MKKRNLILAVLGGGGILLLTVFFLSKPTLPESTKKREISSQIEPPLEQGEIWGPEQDQLADLILTQTKAVIDQNHVPGQPAHRDAHPKAHGCVKAVWNFLDSALLPEQKVGLFAQTAPIQAWVRFSNGAADGFNAPDSNPDLRGMAIKLMTQNGSQDFVMINSPRFFSKDAADYYQLFSAIGKGGVSLLWYLARNLTTAEILNQARAKIENVLTTNYFSPVPFKLGNQSMRFKVVPCADNESLFTAVDATQTNFLRESLLLSLSKGQACYDFYIQPNNDPEKNPIEDPTLVWDEKVSPFIKVARLDILQQSDFTTQPRMNFCENLSFNPWHGHESDNLRPMGQINRVRKLVYDEISKYRHNANHAVEMEPTDFSACEGSAAALCNLQGYWENQLEIKKAP